MKKALIDTTTVVVYVESRTEDGDAVYGTLANSARVAQVVATGEEFEVDSSLQWIDCDDAVVADLYYYDTSDSTIKAIPQN